MTHALINDIIQVHVSVFETFLFLFYVEYDTRWNFFYLSVFHHQKIMLFYFWKTYVWSLFLSSYHEKTNQKIGKTKNILGFKKVTQLVARALVVEKKKENISKSDILSHWHIFIMWKRSNKIKAIKSETFYVTDNLKSQNYCVLFWKY